MRVVSVPAPSLYLSSEACVSKRRLSVVGSSEAMEAGMRRRRAASLGPTESRPNPFWSERARDTFSLQQARPRDLPQLEDLEVMKRPEAATATGASETARGVVGEDDGCDLRAVTGLPSIGAEEGHREQGQASEPSAAAREGKPSLQDVTLMQQRASEMPILEEWTSEGGNASSAAHGESPANGTPRGYCSHA